MAASAGDNEREPLIPVVIPRRPLSDRIVVRVERQEGYTDRVELVVARRVRVVIPHVLEWERRRGARGVHGDECVELEHREARVRHESGESLSKARIGELADGVDVTIDKVLEVGAEALRIHAARKPVIVQTTQEACQWATERWKIF